MARIKKEKKAKKEKPEKTGKKGGKKILILLLALVLLAGGAFAVVRFGLPMLGGGSSDEEGAPPKKGLEAYTIGEDTVASIDTLLEEGEGELIAVRGPGKRKTKEDASASVELGERYTYIYELEGYAGVMDRYLDFLLGDGGFSLVDESYLVLEDRPELEDKEGALVVAKGSVQEGHVFQLAIGWSQASGNLAVRVASPEGALHYPEKQQEPKPASVREQLDSLENMKPSQLTLDGNSMGEYDIYPVQGFVNIDGHDCRRFNFYEKDETGDLIGIIFYSGDMQHVYRMDVDDNSIITELK